MPLVTTVTNVARLLKQSYGYYRYQIVFLALLSFLSGTLEGIGINSVIPLFSFVTKSPDRGSDIVSRLIQNIFAFLHIDYTLRALLLFIIVLFVLKSIFVFITSYISVRITTNYERNTRSR